MVFNVTGKVALVTGGASGLGFQYAKELLRNGAQGVTLADIQEEAGAKALHEIEQEFGAGKAIFVRTDVTNFDQFEAAFKATIDHYKHVDVLINNAGILNDSIWEKEIAINVNGVIHGMLLGIDKYLPKYRQGSEAVILNASSIAGTQGYGNIPVYTATKYAVLGLTYSWGVPEFYDATKVRVVAVCPGATVTPLLDNLEEKAPIRNGIERSALEKYKEWWTKHGGELELQEPEHLAKEVIEIIKHAPHGTSWVVEAGEPAYKYSTPDRSTMKKNKLLR